jgi:PAS domain S-box-containing protein
MTTAFERENELQQKVEELQRQLKGWEDDYNRLYENSLVAMFRMNIVTGEIINSNDKLKSMLESDQLIGDSFYTYISSAVEKEVFQKQLTASKEIESLEFQLITARGNNLWIVFSGAHYTQEQQVDCVLKDITQTKQNLLELQKVNFELDSFVYHASHDLRSPLRSVLGLIDLYRMEQNKEIREECIEKIESSIKRLDLLVMDLLSISRNDRIDEPLREINITNEVANSVASYYNASNTKDLEIITKIHQPVRFVSDLTRVRIILNNLISNAIKYRSFHKDRSFIIIDVKVNKEEALIIIEDNGEGIEESKLPHIFDMFYRATEKSEGSGLGLYIVKKVADKLNAKIEVDSVELEGTTFTVVLPNLHDHHPETDLH